MMVDIKKSIEIAKPLIKNFEGLASATPPPNLTYIKKEGNPNDKVYAYWDKFAKIYTIGWGSIRLNGRPVTASDVITRKQAEILFEKEVIEHEGYIRKMVDLSKVNENQYAVLISLTYNAGPGNVRNTRILPAINSGKPASEVSQIIKDSLTTSRGAVVPGLVDRRKKESQFYLKVPEIINENKGKITIALVSFVILASLSFVLYKKYIKK